MSFYLLNKEIIFNPSSAGPDQNFIITMPADALAPNGARPSAGMVLTDWIDIFSIFHVSLVINDFESPVIKSPVIKLVAWSAPSHYLNQCWNIVNWTLGNKLQWHFNLNSNIFIHENGSESVCEMAAILSQPQCVKSFKMADKIWNISQHFECSLISP